MKEKYVEMTLDEMKQVKEVWKGYFKTAKNNIKYIQTIEETKENRWELKTLEVEYSFFIDHIKKIVKIYAAMICDKESGDLEPEHFAMAMKVLQILNNELHEEFKKKSFKELNAKYIEGLETITTA